MTPIISVPVIIIRVFFVAQSLPAIGERIIPITESMVLKVENAERLIPRSSHIGTVKRLRQLSSSVKNVPMIRVQATTIHQP